MIVEKGHFHFAEKYWGDQGTHVPPPVPTALYPDIFFNDNLVRKALTKNI